MFNDCLLKRFLASVIRNYPKEKIVEIKADFNKALKRVKRKRKTLNKLERLSNQPFSLK